MVKVEDERFGLQEKVVARQGMVGIAMANAHPAVLRSARYMTLSNAEDGVAHALEHLIARFG